MRYSKTFPAMLTYAMLLLAAIVFVAAWGYQQYLSRPKVHNPSYSTLVTPGPQQEKHENPADSLMMKLEQLKRLQREIADLIIQEQERYEEAMTALQRKKQFLDSIGAMLNQVPAPVTGPNGKEHYAHPPTSRHWHQTRNYETVEISNINLQGLKENRATSQEAATITTFQGSFYLKASDVTSGELAIVIRKPDGSVLSGSQARSQDKTDSTLYSTIIQFDPGNQRVTFSIHANDLQRGLYTVAVYYKGGLIASLQKTLH